MMRLIDADALVDHLSNCLMKEIFPEYESFQFEEKLKIGRLAKEFKKELLNAPTIEVEPVVRCKECKHWDREWIPSMYTPADETHFCPMVDKCTYDDFFCADGEKMDLEDK